MHWLEWGVLAAYTLALWAVAPRARDERTFFWAHSRQAPAPSTLLLTISVLVTWIFAKSITNAANLGEKYGVVGGLAYAGWYLSIPAAGWLIYRIRKGGHEGLVPFLTDHFGPLAAFLFSLAILIRLFNEIWSNTAVVASYFGGAGSTAYYLGAFLFTAGVLVYSVRGGLRASIFTDRLQFVLALVLLAVVLGWILPKHGPVQLLSTGSFRLDAGVDLLLVALLQVTSYPFHDPVLTDRAFVNAPSKMLRAYLVAGVLGGLFIVLYSTIGIDAKLSGLTGPGDAPVRVARALGAAAVAVISVLMMNSAGACLDSAFSAMARHVAVDLAGEGGTHPSGFRGLVGPLRRLAATDGGLALGRWTMIVFAVLGNLPLFWKADILKATTISGTMVIGLAPPFLLWRWHRPAPLAFLLSFTTGLAVGIWAVAGHWPAGWKIGTGAYAGLLGQNLYGLVCCFALYGVGVAIEAVRGRATVLSPRYFTPRPAEDG